MRSSLVTVCLVASAPAWAGEKPVRGPAPAWVVDVAEPARPGKAPEPTSADAPITVLLSDTQLRFERGAVTSYVRTLFRIGNAQGLAAGNISIPWHPDLGDLGIHRLVIRRGDRVIDVLGNEGAVTVVRREPNLESAMLDGVLTANIQPEGLEVGDLVELATSVSVRDRAAILSLCMSQLIFACAWIGYLARMIAAACCFMALILFRFSESSRSILMLSISSRVLLVYSHTLNALPCSTSTPMRLAHRGVRGLDDRALT